MKNTEQTPKRILVVDDESVIRALVQRAIDPTKCDLILAGSVQEGMEQIDRMGFDLLLADLRRPDGNGVDIIRHFKTKYPGAPVLVITGSLTPEERLLQVEGSGVTDCIQKPFDLQVLQKAIYQALEKTCTR